MQPDVQLLFLLFAPFILFGVEREREREFFPARAKNCVGHQCIYFSELIWRVTLEEALGEQSDAKPTSILAHLAPGREAFGIQVGFTSTIYPEQSNNSEEGGLNMEQDRNPR